MFLLYHSKGCDICEEIPSISYPQLVSYNMKADAPLWRAPTPHTVISRRCVLSASIPSGVVVVCACFELGGDEDGAGLDCVLQIRSKVLYADCQDLIVTLFIIRLGL
jgi:hypothetical protein